ncbi:g11515 [Coccomyxa viridis]|uniref:G11515 protein n=1 Tax=Coccomyxa viridis TaxID=1274662 RepID=A0ABP1GAU4_9CHLO
MSPTMTLTFSSQTGPPSPSPVPALNSTSNSTVLSANAAQSVMIVALPAAIVIAILAIVLVLSFARLPARLQPPHLTQQLEAAAAHPGKAEAPLQPLFREMPVVLLQPDQQILIGKRLSAPSSPESLHFADQEIYIVVLQP